MPRTSASLGAGSPASAVSASVRARPGTRAPAVPISVANAASAPVEHTLDVASVARRELDALSSALARGPVDGDFLLALQGRFAETPLATPMAEQLVRDALRRLLPPEVDVDARQAWQDTSTSMLTCSRAGWEVACAPLRSRLTLDVADTSLALRRIRDAVYRPVDIPGHVWRECLFDARTAGATDARALAVSLQPNDLPAGADISRVRLQLRMLAPMLDDALLERSVHEIFRHAALDGGLLDPRCALHGLFDAVDEDGRAVLDAGARARILAGLGELESPGRRRRGGLLTGQRTAPGAQLADALLAVGRSATLCSAPARQPPMSAMLLAAASVPGGVLTWLGALALPTPATLPAGVASEPLRPPAPVVPVPVQTGNASWVTPDERCRLPFRGHDGEGPPGDVASSAARSGGNGLLAMASGGLFTGAMLMRLGWQWAFPAAVDPHPRVRGAQDEHVSDVIAFLEDVVDEHGNATLWQDICRQVREADARGDAADPAIAVAELLRSSGVAGRVVDGLHAGLADETSGRPGGRAAREKRNVHDVNPVAAPAAIIREEMAAQRRLDEASQRLIQAAREGEGAAEAPGALSFQPGDGLPDAEAAGMIQFWQALVDETLDSRHELAIALNQLADSELLLDQVHAAMPSLDGTIAAALSAALDTATDGGNASSVDPRQVYRNTFLEIEPWERWAAGHPRPPSLRDQPGTRVAQPGGRVRSQLASSYTLVEAAVLPVEDGNHTALYLRTGPSTYFPNQECQRPSLAQFNAAIAGRNFVAEFTGLHAAYAASAGSRAGAANMARFCEGFVKRLSGASVLLCAGARLSARGKWLLDMVLLHPQQFNAADPASGRALVLPNAALRVHPLAVYGNDGALLPLHGMMLIHEVADGGAVLLASTSRTPVVEEFDGVSSALRQIEAELPGHLNRWMARRHHAAWHAGRAATVGTRPAERGNFLEALFLQTVDLRHQQLLDLQHASPAVARREFLAFDRRMARYPPAVPLPILTATAQLAAGSLSHWLAGADGDAAGLRNLDFQGVRILYDLNGARSELEQRYPLLPRFVASTLDQAVLASHGVAFDSRRYALVQFSGGAPSTATRSGWSHAAHQRIGSMSLVECALRKGEGLPRGSDMAMRVGLYLSADADVYDQKTEATEIRPEEFLAIVDRLDLQGAYLAALAAFWEQERDQVGYALRGSYVFSISQQYGDGSLSVRGVQLALAASGRLVLDADGVPQFAPEMRAGVRVGWLELYGMQSTIVHVQDDDGPERILYFPNDRNRFFEFAHPQEMMSWLQRLVATDAGCTWIEAAFDLSDLQDGWFYNGLQTMLGSPDTTLSASGRMSRPIEGHDLIHALMSRLRARTESDARVLMTSDWEAVRHQWLVRMQTFNLVMGLASIVLPPLLPVVAVGSVAELGLGADQAINGETEAERHAGGGAAAGAAFGLGLMAPLGVGRLARLAASDGSRLTPALQLMGDGAALDPLRALSPRYAQPLLLDGVRAADNGVYRHIGRTFIRQGEFTYEVFFDDAAHTWRLRHPGNGLQYNDPIRLNGDGLWEPNPEVGLRGGAPRGDISRSVSIESSYRGAVNAYLAKVRAGATDIVTDDFRWGRENWRRVRLTNGEMSLPELKRQFLDGGLDMVQKGALSEIISRLEALQRSGWYARLGADIDELVQLEGGQFYPASQGLLFEDTALGAAGVCTGLSRIMAVAVADGTQLQLLRNLRAAVMRPGSRLAATARAMALDAQGVALPRNALSHSEVIEVQELARFLGGVVESSQFVLSGTSHSMMCSVSVAQNGRRTYALYDPNFGLVQFASMAQYERWLPTYFGIRPFPRMPGVVSGQVETLADLYGAYRAPGAASPQFQLRQIDAAVLRQQAHERGWTTLIQREPSP